jgi:hypothetical protein
VGRALRRRPVVAATGVAVLAAALLIVLTSGDDGGEPQPDGDAGDLVEMLRGRIALPEPSEPEAPEVKGPRYAIARVLPGEKVELRERPEGELIERLGDETEFGSQRNFWIVRSEGEWLGVAAPELPNGELGWIRDDGGELEILETPYFITADISERTLELHYGNRILERFPVTVGAPGSPTPAGAYAVTDGLAGAGVGPYYGCCILALSGHQPNLPPDWLGGDRIAIHGTPGGVGDAASAGCLRASDTDMVSLFARVPLGAPVFIRA